MKFRPSAAIAIYYLFTILFISLFTHASDVEQTSHSDIKPELEPAIHLQDSDQNLQFQYPKNKCDIFHGIKKQIITLQEKYEKNRNLISSLEHDLIPFLNQIKKQIHSLQQQLPTSSKLLHEIKKDILSIIFNHFLTMQDILILRETSKDFQFLLQPNEHNMVMFCKDFSSKEIEEVPLIWFNLKYFLKQSYINALAQMKVYKIKTEISRNQYAIITHTNDKKIISWYNNERISHENTTLLPIQSETPTIYTKNKKVWAKITKERNVETGGDEREEGRSDSKFVQDQLKKVKMIFSTLRAFAALLENGRVVAWGNVSYGGKIPAETQTQLKNVKMIFSTNYAFAALLEDSRVFIWGSDRSNGGKTTDLLQAQLKNVQMIYTNYHAFVALLNDGSIVARGRPNYGGKIPENIQTQIQNNVKMVFSTQTSFAALLEDGRVFAWGDRPFGGNNPQKQLKNVNMIVSTDNAFTALLNDGNVVAWGDVFLGGKIPDKIQNQLQDVKMIVSNYGAFVALLSDGSVVAWGWPYVGGEIPNEIQIQLSKNSKMIFSSRGAFAALLEDGSVVAWGGIEWGGKIPDEIQIQLKNVKNIFPHSHGFTALCHNGKVITWHHIDKNLKNHGDTTLHKKTKILQNDKRKK